MNHARVLSFRNAGLLAAGALLCAGSAFAADTAGRSAQELYRAERAACEAGQTGQARQTCLREAGAALQERQRGRLQTSSHDYRANAAARCDRLPPERREGCMALRGDNVQVQGSVQGGAILRQTTIREVGEPVTPGATGTMGATGTSGAMSPASSAPISPGASGTYTPSQAPGTGYAPAPASGTGYAPAPATTPGTGYTPAPTPGTGLR